MHNLTSEGQRLLEEIGRRNGFSTEAMLALLQSVRSGRGTMAQFSHPELGGMGQWTRGGMIMIGDMFNNALKARVDAACSELAGLLDRADIFAAPVGGGPGGQFQGQSSGTLATGGFGFSDWWPQELGSPASAGAQNDMRYAWFPGTRRLAIDRGGSVTIYDTGEHLIGGVSQQQGGGYSLTFTSQFGTVRLDDLPVVSGGPNLPPAIPASNAPPQPAAAAIPSASGGDAFGTLERLADLHQKGILSAEEFAAKKAEILSRL